MRACAERTRGGISTAPFYLLLLHSDVAFCPIPHRSEYPPSNMPIARPSLLSSLLSFRLACRVFPPSLPSSPYYIWVGLGSVGNDIENMPLTTRLRQPGYRFLCFCLGGRPLIVELDHLCKVNILQSAPVGMVTSRSIRGKAPKRQLHSTPIAVSGGGYTGKLKYSLKLSSICKSASQAVCK